MRKNPQNMRCVGYARPSRSRRGQNSIKRQHKLINKHATRLTGRKVDAFYDDPNFAECSSGLEQLIADAAAGVFDVVIVEDIDRVARCMSTLAAILQQLRKSGVVLHSSTKGGPVEWPATTPRSTPHA